ncbi:ATP-dependent zinc metalloprotease FtsH [Capsicum annuum]|uniref:ATP-dependent zinc metalloprotease FtsH n=1 Tax=Capsicum annuum TaxID=4072 RepID=A0A2G2Y8P1_CAPAN|nr:ATP-dependent zinc metalloprotease FtsH [Capsicum annuum]KAF3652865.1 ATP-dependent zinc metalloprotease FtsH [Capsicum annuum]PHT66094.1 ATP-dependent zinc metalloprotease FtsH [Capsicum annuum]
MISCNSESPKTEEEKKTRTNQLGLLNLSVTLTVISASLVRPANAAKVSEKRQRSTKKSEVLTPQELKKWSEGLPTVSNRLPYTEILDLKKEGKLKHIIKPPNVGLKQRPEVVLAVLEDSKVVRIVLPSVESDPRFWAEWDELKLDGLCMNAYTPPLKKPELPWPYLGFLSKIPVWLFSFVKAKPQSKRALELKRAREELKRRRKQELAKIRSERERMENAIKLQKKMEESKRKRELKKMRYEESLRQASSSSQDMARMWENLASDSNVSTALGLVFFYIFYRTVVFSYRRQKKDYEDRLKIEKADAEEKKKMRELEREMEGLEGVDDDDEEGRKGEENPYMKMAMQFMKSGARVRRARNKKLPQYLERGVDVKFSDVAGLGKIREELEEIVKFFTHGEMYRRRGVKIPGGILLCGPPGVGKTLLAKAVAGEAGVNFFSISASQFVEIYVGVGASRVRALYQEARDNAPSVVFIDELDAVGRERGLIKGSGGQERDATLNQLLVCLDGFEGKGEVITIASTNRPDILDPALVRPGRFDRKIYIPKPGLIGRIEILKVHARKKPMAPDVDYMAVASMTDGMVGAELANIVEVAAINMMRDTRTEIQQIHEPHPVDMQIPIEHEAVETDTPSWVNLHILELSNTYGVAFKVKILSWSVRVLNSWLTIRPWLKHVYGNGRWMWFAYSKLRGSNHQCNARLDRFLYSMEWEENFRNFRQRILPRATSDHNPIILECGIWEQRQSYFKFENWWLKVEGFNQLVHEWWNGFLVEGCPEYKLCTKLKMLKLKLKKWSRNAFSEMANRKNSLLEELSVWDKTWENRELSQDE